MMESSAERPPGAGLADHKADADRLAQLEGLAERLYSSSDAGLV